MPINAIRRKEVANLMPEGVIATREWLMERGLSRHAIDNLIKSNSLACLTQGVYVRGTAKIDWQSVVYTLQSIMKTELVIGGMTALEMQGLSHYLSLAEKKTIHLYGKEKMPSWVNKLIPEVTFIRHQAPDLMEEIPTEAPIAFNNQDSWRSFTLEQAWRADVGNLILSSPERAYLEVLLDVPQKISFEHADQLMQGLTTLSPRNLQRLLERWNHVKAKRLFFWFAERHNYAWLKKLCLSSIHMGSGNRMLVKGGKLNKKYKITVPELL